jgi:sulfur carrier protein
MKYFVNGEPYSAEKDTYFLTEILRFLNISSLYYAVALNGEFVHKENYPTTLIREGDRLEIVTPFPGG